jgi:hypothetical protein
MAIDVDGVSSSAARVTRLICRDSAASGRSIDTFSLPHRF